MKRHKSMFPFYCCDMMLLFYFRQPVDPAKWRKIGLIFIAIGSVVLLASIGITVRLDKLHCSMLLFD